MSDAFLRQRRFFSEEFMPSEKNQANLNSRRGGIGAPLDRRCNERRCNYGRRYLDRENRYAVEAVLTAREACRYISISQPTLIKLIMDSRIRAQKVGRRWRILRAEIDRFLRGGRVD